MVSIKIPIFAILSEVPTPTYPSINNFNGSVNRKFPKNYQPVSYIAEIIKMFLVHIMNGSSSSGKKKTLLFSLRTASMNTQP